MSYYGLTMSDYQPPDAGTPGWNLAPVPGWGMNPARSGPARVGVGGCGCSGSLGADEMEVAAESGYAGDQYLQYTLGHVAFATAGGLALGMILMYAWMGR